MLKCQATIPLTIGDLWKIFRREVNCIVVSNPDLRRVWMNIEEGF